MLTLGEESFLIKEGVQKFNVIRFLTRKEYSIRSLFIFPDLFYLNSFHLPNY